MVLLNLIFILLSGVVTCLTTKSVVLMLAAMLTTTKLLSAIYNFIDYLYKNK